MYSMYRLQLAFHGAVTAVAQFGLDLQAGILDGDPGATTTMSGRMAYLRQCYLVRQTTFNHQPCPECGWVSDSYESQGVMNWSCFLIITRGIHSCK